jgi:hypothetical protein
MKTLICPLCKADVNGFNYEFVRTINGTIGLDKEGNIEYDEDSYYCCECREVKVYCIECDEVVYEGTNEDDFIQSCVKEEKQITITA